MNWKIILILGLGVSHLTWASQVGGGGNAVICFNQKENIEEIKKNNDQIPSRLIGQITQVELLDMALARLPRGVPPKIVIFRQPMSGEVGPDFVLRLASLLEPYVKPFPNRLRNAVNSFRNENIHWASNGLFKVTDYSLPIPLENELCVVATIAVQIFDANEWHLYLDGRIFTLEDTIFSPTDRVALWLHEMVRHQRLKLGHYEGDGKDGRPLIVPIVIGPNGSRPTRVPIYTNAEITRHIQQTVELLMIEKDIEANELVNKLNAYGFREVTP